MAILGKVEVHLKEQSLPVVHIGVINAYTKGELYCVYSNNNLVYKYPIRDIFRVIEEYNTQKGS